MTTEEKRHKIYVEAKVQERVTANLRSAMLAALDAYACGEYEHDTDEVGKQTIDALQTIVELAKATCQEAAEEVQRLLDDVGPQAAYVRVPNVEYMRHDGTSESAGRINDWIEEEGGGSMMNPMSDNMWSVIVHTGGGHDNAGPGYYVVLTGDIWSVCSESVFAERYKAGKGEK